ncbi:MAG: hypothetical protein LBQ54_05585 [Planctomycetaceae bacterium]|nr:hypothetical protein [Planctomycetaceae bacterium]
MPSKDFIPAADAAFHNWQSNLLTMITANKATNGSMKAYRCTSDAS